MRISLFSVWNICPPKLFFRPGDIFQLARHRRGETSDRGETDQEQIGFRLWVREAGFDRGNHRLAAVAGDEPARGRHGSIGEFSREHEIFATTLQQLAENLLGRAKLIDIGGVDEAIGLSGGANAPRQVEGYSVIPFLRI